MTLIRDFRKGAKVLQQHWVYYRYCTRDIARQKRNLQNYRTDITKVINCTPVDSSTYAVFVYYEPDQEVSPSVQRVLVALRELNINTLVLCNHKLTDAQRSFLSEQTHSIVLRNNQGFDFGSFKDAVTHLQAAAPDLTRLLLMNDSVFYSSRGLKGFLKNLAGPEDVVGAYENWGEDHHLQSFALSFSGDVFRSPSFVGFWNDYVPVNNRVHAIEDGEKKLTKAALTNAHSSRVIYSASELAAKLAAGQSEMPDTLTIFPQPWRAGLEELSGEDLSWGTMVNKIVDVVNVTSTVHSGAYLFPKFLESPVYKKDLVYRGRFQFWEMQTWLTELMPAEEIAEYLGILRRKGDSSSLDATELLKFQVGAK